MPRHTITAALCFAAVLLLASCGKQGKAESVVKDFLDDNLRTADYAVSFSKIDSTRLVTDSIVNAMRLNAARNKAFKQGITYGAEPPQPVYVYTKATICIDADTLRHTFYLNRELTQVVSFKDN